MSNTDTPPFRYNAALAAEIESRWQQNWLEHKIYETPNPIGGLAEDNNTVAHLPKLFIMDMFPYPSGSGLHVGHPLGYIATDVYSRFKRMTGFNVLHTMGFDAFGLPAEEHARQTGQHPRTNTEANIANMTRQLDRLGLGHDKRRAINTTDVDYYRWTQWIFLQMFNSWFDPETERARPIHELVSEFNNGSRPTPNGAAWTDMNSKQKASIINNHRLAYVADVPVNWCPALGTVLSNEEITAQGRSERGNHEVFQRPLKQWMLRITAYADRLIQDLDLLDWPESVKTMQQNWIGRSVGARISFPVANTAISQAANADTPPTSTDTTIDVFTTRPDTIFGVTYMVLAPDHPLVDTLVAQVDKWPEATSSIWTGGASTPSEAVANYRAQISNSTTTNSSETHDSANAQHDAEASDKTEARHKTGVYIGVDALVPVNGRRVPIFIADYVLMSYGTGAVMAVPGEDERDWAFAKEHKLPIIRTVQPPSSHNLDEAYTGDGTAINSGFLNGLDVEAAKVRIVDWLAQTGHGTAAVTYKLRDWLFSRQRYWGEPFPIVFNDDDMPVGLPESMLPVKLPDLMDWRPRSLNVDSPPEPPLGRVTDWVNVKLDIECDGNYRSYRRELNTMPQWAGSCWYYLRYLDPLNEKEFVDREVERYWMSGGDADTLIDGETGALDVGGVDLYVGGVEHAVLHLLYARFWHKVLYDLGFVSNVEPFKRLVNQGYVLAAAFQDERGVYVPADEVEGTIEKGFTYCGQKVNRVSGKMGKSLKNAVTPDDMYASYGADTLRLYEMFMGPIDQDRPWETRSVVGSHRMLQRVWRNIVDEHSGKLRVCKEPADRDLRQLLHKTVHGVHTDMNNLRFNTAIAKITELNNVLTRRDGDVPHEVAEALIKMLAPLVPHIAEELWQRLQNSEHIEREHTLHQDVAPQSQDAAPSLHSASLHSVVWEKFPEADASLLVDKTVELPVQVNGKVRGRIEVDANAETSDVIAAALTEPNVLSHIAGKQIRKQIYVNGKIVTFVV